MRCVNNMLRIVNRVIDIKDLRFYLRVFTQQYFMKHTLKRLETRFRRLIMLHKSPPRQAQHQKRSIPGVNAGFACNAN